MISFDNTEVAFRGKSPRDLRRAYWLFKMVASPFFVKMGKWLTKVAIALHLPVKGLIKRTIFRQFCGGENIAESLATSKELGDRNVKTILDYSIEGKTKEEDFDSTVNEIIATINEAAKNENIPFAVFKVTGICLFNVLEKANQNPENLSGEDLANYIKVIERIDEICKAAYGSNVPLFIDAEETWIQDTIDRIVQVMMRKYNREKAIVYNTVQLYRHDRLEFLKREIETARKEGYFYGVKLVRGAYMEKERERAEKMGYLSPIQPNKTATDRDFNSALEVVIDNIDIVSVCCGTHNEHSSRYLAELIDKKGISHTDSRVFFAQLLGMSDHISFNLADHNYLVAKYVPYGPVKEVLPYLIRRAEENTSVAGQTGRELSLIIKEEKRRKSEKI